MEIAAEQQARASAFVEGVEPIPSGERRRKKQSVLIQDVPQVHPAPMDVDTLAHAMIHQANSTKELSDKWMALSEHNNLLGLNYTKIVADSLERGYAMSTGQLRQLALWKDQEIRDAHKAGMQEREGYLNMMHAVFNKMNEHLTTTVGILSNQDGRISEVTRLLWEAHVRSQEAQNKQRELEFLMQSNGSGPGPGGGGGAIDRGRTTGRKGDAEVAAIPETNPAADAAMDRAVQIAPARRALSVDEMKDGLRGTVAKIRKITTPEDVIPDDVIRQEAGHSGFGAERSRPTARVGPYPSARPNTDRREHSLPPVLPPLAPAPVLPTNGPHKEANWTQLRDASLAREASAKPSTATAVTVPRERPGRSRTPLRQDLVRPSRAPVRPSQAPARPPSRAPSEEVGRALTPAQSLHGTVASYRSASHEATSVSASHRSASRVSQRSSSLIHSASRERSPRRGQEIVPVPSLRPPRNFLREASASADSVGREPSGDFARGQTPDKRFKAASGLPVKRYQQRNQRRQRGRTMLSEMQNRD